MLKCIYKSRGLLRFFAPDGGGGSGGGGSSSGASGGAAGGSGSGGEPIKTPFDDLPWDELPDEDRAKFEKAKSDYVATLQDAAKTKADLARVDQQARQFQSQLDRLKAEQDKKKRQDEPDPYLNAIEEELRGAGLTPEQIAAQAPVFAGMFKRLGGLTRAEMGRELAPLTGTVLAQEATLAFQTAYNNDRLGMLQIPEVANTVWDYVKGRVEANQPTDEAVVLNLAKMAWTDHVAEHGLPEGFTAAGAPAAAAGGEPRVPGPLPVAPPIPSMRTGGVPIRGGGGTPIVARPADPNAAKTQLNDDTRNALAQTFRTMGSDTGVFPKEFAPAAGKGKGGR